MHRIMKTVYELIMIVLVMLTIMTIWTEDSSHSTIHLIVWIVFVIDYFFRFITAHEKWTFVKENPFLLIAVIPFDQFFQLARIVRVIYLFRIKTITKYYVSPYIEKLSFQSMTLILFILSGLLLVESAVIYQLESSITVYWDAVYITIGYLFTFGNQLHTVDRPVIMWLLIGTSIMGIMVQGVALQWVLTKGEKILSKLKRNRIKES